MKTWQLQEAKNKFSSLIDKTVQEGAQFVSKRGKRIVAIIPIETFEKVFSKQIMALGMPHDILLAISTSGSSTNMIHAIKAAKERGMHIIAMSGGDGGNLVELLTDDDIHIGVPHDNPSRIQETYILIVHCLCDAIDCLLLGVN